MDTREKYESKALSQHELFTAMVSLVKRLEECKSFDEDGIEWPVDLVVESFANPKRYFRLEYRSFPFFKEG